MFFITGIQDLAQENAGILLLIALALLASMIIAASIAILLRRRVLRTLQDQGSRTQQIVISTIYFLVIIPILSIFVSIIVISITVWIVSVFL